ncbi:Conserved_hypothetical protein [Hexamita inflata]|uniref:Cilia- and flagella-associated protein 61 N-terminal domain-containing protein n=1 Tax=Hexamita inflata TaxID=28002 RepID=A0AA86RPX4_9EUKA|nr:Conserved hypothetical protein [Hexamita inflata]
MYAVRDLTQLDYERCDELCTDPLYQRMFSSTSIAQLHLKCSYASVAVCDGEVEAVLLVSQNCQYFEDIEANAQPGAPSGSRCPALFTEYIETHYEVSVPLLTSKFVRLVACAPNHRQALSALIRAYFSFDPKHEILLLNVYPYSSPPDQVRELFPELDQRVPLPTNNCLIRICQRADVLTPLAVKPAQMKDHDDLVQIFEQQNTNLRQRFGEFFLADLIKGSDTESKLALVGSDFEVNSTEIQKPVCFLYAERFNQFNSAEDSQIYSNLLATHQIEKYGVHAIPTDHIAFIRATACVPQAESRSGDLIQYLFEQWKDVELLILCLPSNSSCTNMQILRLFTLIEPRSCLSPKESLFVCNRDAWVSGINVQPIVDQENLMAMKEYLKLQVETNKQLKRIDLELQQLSPDCTNGTLVAFSYIKGRKAPIALATVDLTIGRLNDQDILKNYLTNYEHQILKLGKGRIINSLELDDPTYTTPENTIWKPAEVLHCQKWCNIHFDFQLQRYGFLKSFVVDPVFLQFKDDLLDSFMEACGVEGFLLNIGFEMQQFIKPIYKQEQFIEQECDPQQILTSFEKELFRTSDYVQNVEILNNPNKQYYDAQLGSHYGVAPKEPAAHLSCENSTYTADSKLHQQRLADEKLFNDNFTVEERSDIFLAGIRSLKPNFSLFCIQKQNQIRLFQAPVHLANEPQQQFIVKPPTVLTDRLVIVGFGQALLAALQTIQDCHQLAKFKSITVVHPAPGMIYPFNFAAEYQQFLYDHGESLPEYKKRCVNLFFDQFVGDIYEINMKDGFLKLASGSEVCFDLLMICPDGADSETLRAVPYYNLNSSVAFNYGNVDPCSLAQQTNVLQGGNQLSQFNKRGFNEDEICHVLSEQKNYARMLSSLYNEYLLRVGAKKVASQQQEQSQLKFAQRFVPHNSSQLNVFEIVKQRLHARTFFRFLSRDSQMMRKQLAAVHCASYLSNLNYCISQLYSPTVQKLMQKPKKEEEETKAQQVQNDDDQRVTATANGYRYLSPGSKTSQFLQINHPEVQAQLPLIMDRIASIIDEARRQLFPMLFSKLPPRADQRTSSVQCTIADASRTTVCVVGDTFEAFSLVQGFLDRGVPADSICLLLPQDPNADIDPIDEKQTAEIEFLLNQSGYCRTQPKINSHIPQILGKIQQHTMSKNNDQQAHIESKSTVQQAEKRTEGYPLDLHRSIHNAISLAGVNVLQNVKIIDVLASQTQNQQKMHEDEAENKSEENSDNSDENSEDEEDIDLDEEEFDETKEIDDQMILDSLEQLDQLDELDIVLGKEKVPGFAQELENLNEVLDEILLGNSDEVLRKELAPNDPTFDINQLPDDQKLLDLNRLLKIQITKLYKLSKQIQNKKRRHKKKSYNGASLCGLRVQYLKNEEEDTAVEAKKNIVTKTTIGRMFTGSNGISIRMLMTNADGQQVQTQSGNQVDIHCCAVFLTEAFGVPNNISSAIMRSDLVFDKALILNSFGQSSDYRVFAAGNISKINRSTLLKKIQTGLEQDHLELPFSPVLLTQDPIKPVVTWSLYSQHETAQYSSYQLISNRISQQEETGLVPEFARPLVLSAKVSDGYIFRVSRPLRDIRDQKLIAMKLFRVIETGDLSGGGLSRRWCRVEVDPLGIVDSFTVYGKEQLKGEFKELVFKVVGMPVSLFNQLEQRWQKGEVSDLLDFFCQQNVQALLNPSVISTINDLLTDIIISKDFKNESIVNQIPENSRTISDVKETVFTTEIGYNTLKSQPHNDRIFNMLVETAKKIATTVEERYFELGGKNVQRGIVKFDK